MSPGRPAGQPRSRRSTGGKNEEEWRGRPELKLAPRVHRGRSCRTRNGGKCGNNGEWVLKGELVLNKNRDDRSGTEAFSRYLEVECWAKHEIEGARIGDPTVQEYKRIRKTVEINV